MTKFCQAISHAEQYLVFFEKKKSELYVQISRLHARLDLNDLLCTGHDPDDHFTSTGVAVSEKLVDPVLKVSS